MLYKYVLNNIWSKIVFRNEDFRKNKKYTANFNSNNDKNDLYYILKTAIRKNTSLLNSCMDIDINKTR